VLFFRREGVVVGDSAGANLTGDVVVDGGNELLRPTKTGQVGILFLCSILESVNLKPHAGGRNYIGSSFGSQPSRLSRQ